MEGLLGVPRGKVEPGESPENALKREIWEELETRIVIERFVRTIVRASAPQKKTPLKEQHQQEEKEQQNRIFKLRYKHNDANCKNGGYDDHERSWFAVVTG